MDSVNTQKEESRMLNVLDLEFASFRALVEVTATEKKTNLVVFYEFANPDMRIGSLNLPLILKNFTIYTCITAVAKVDAIYAKDILAPITRIWKTYGARELGARINLLGWFLSEIEE